ncbi:histidine kinase [Gelatoporia subvermispora B]|uniref:Histidine kinase n=1 Tax=Ceriporiopsis subvermispora (strain B) TaxID=914234 RepID=M2RMI3_CERS8|nr:histidine kinase [Gelatoporia subvermispora B]
MTTEDDARQVKETPRTTQHTTPSVPTTSYVYPVRSLLSGVQAAAPTGQRQGDSNYVRPTTVPEGDIHAASASSANEGLSAGQGGSQPSASVDNTSKRSAEFPRRPPNPRSGSEKDDVHSRRRKHRHRTPNFRDFPQDENPLAPRTFTTSPSESPLRDSNTPSNSADMFFVAGPSGEPVIYLPSRTSSESDEEPDYKPRRPTQISEVAAEGFSVVAPTASILPGVLPRPPELSRGSSPSNFSQSGIVHLPPIGTRPSSSHGSRSVGSSARGRTSRISGECPVTSPAQSANSAQNDVEAMQLSSDQASRPSSPLPSMSGSSSSMTGSSGSGVPHVTFRYQHVEDEDGHHLIVGREGELTKCEDEPIRAPGAVQGFGILIAVEEDEETGNLVVRQVSENSTELLGLSPKYLFAMDCFSQTLPDNQADVLFDNIQYLSDPSLTPEEQAENLHVFMLSGWGEPGTALVEDANQDEQRRRHWTVWCAAHRPEMTAPPNTTGSGSAGIGRSPDYSLIILEFELERDVFNPLYPSLISEEASVRSGVSSPSDASGSTSNSSGRTLVSTTSGETDAMVTPSDSNSSPGSCDPSVIASITATSSSQSSSSPYSLPGSDEWLPSAEDILESTTSRSKPLLALERLRRTRQTLGEAPSSPVSAASGMDRGGSRFRRSAARQRRGGGAVGMMDVFAVMAQINEQLGAAPDLETFLKVTAGVIKDLTQFHRVLVYQFDELWNGQVVAELVDWNQTHDLFRGLHFPAGDIPAQARTLYALNKVRILYDRGQPTARLVVRSKQDLETPLDMTHCYLRAMSPIHLKYLENMGVRASMSVSIIAFGQLWGLVACHSYGSQGMRVSFPVRQMLRLLSQSISRNIERLSYAQRLHTRKLINTMPSDQHPSGYIVSNADDLLGLFDADYGVLVIGEGAKILGPNFHGQEILIVAEYLRLKQFDTIQVSQAVTQDYPDLPLTSGLEIIAGLLYVPLSAGGRDFIAFLRRGQPRQVNWAGRPYRDGEQKNLLEPRTSFRIWSETVAGRCRAWSDEHLETAGVLALVYGKFIEVWRQKENALQTTKLTNILLSNASHEVRTPLNHIINYLELALNGPLDVDTRENLSQSHAASKSLLFTINDLLDLTRLESGNETSFNELFDLHKTIEDATLLYRNEAARRGLGFQLDVKTCPRMVVGDARKIHTVVANLTANALKYTKEGSISIQCHTFEEPTGLRTAQNVAVEIIVSDTGCGIPSEKLESIFREFEQVETAPSRGNSPGLGLGLAVVARIVEQLGGQLRVDSRLNEGSRFSFLIPFAMEISDTHTGSASSSSRSSLLQTRHSSNEGSRGDQIDNLVEALSFSHMSQQRYPSPGGLSQTTDPTSATHHDCGKVDIVGSGVPLRPVKVDEYDLDLPLQRKPPQPAAPLPRRSPRGATNSVAEGSAPSSLRILIVEDNDINRMILSKRLSLDGHTVVNTTNGQEGLELLESDWDFDCVLMDIQMPLLNGYEATERIRALEHKRKEGCRLSHKLNGRLPIFAVSASLYISQREELHRLGMDGWILKPIDFKRLRNILKGVVDLKQREKDVYHVGSSWEQGGWLAKPLKVNEHQL